MVPALSRGYAVGLIQLLFLAPAAAAPTPREEVVVQAPEPRFVAPTQRDKIGRIWAPVFLNGRGPADLRTSALRLIFFTTASLSPAHIIDYRRRELELRPH